MQSIPNRLCRWLVNRRIISQRQICVWRYALKFHRFPRVNNPVDLNEKILWLEFNTDISQWAELADKYRVRQFVEQRGCADILIPLQALYDSPDQVDFAALRPPYVMKTNNGCGSVLLVHDAPTPEQQQQYRAQLTRWFNEPFGYISGEKHYSAIQPKILVEDMLPWDKTKSESIVDYKFFCFNGRAEVCLTCSDRSIAGHNVTLNFFELPGWKMRKDWLHPSFQNPLQPERPERLDEMIQYAERLAQGFPLVRVDLYLTADGQIRFGEMTFTSNGGRMRYLSDAALLELGSRVSL